MGLFKRKPQIIKGIQDGAWGHLVSVHGIDVDTLSRDIRCVEKKGALENGEPVTFLRVFQLPQISEKGIEVTGWETFDSHPELVLFEGYIDRANQAHLKKTQL